MDKLSVNGDQAPRQAPAGDNQPDSPRPPPPRPVALPVQPDGIPAELKALPQWVVWRYTWNDRKKRKDGSGLKGDWDKVPHNPNGGRLASTTDPTTWGTFAEALAAYRAGGWDGVGLVHRPENDLTGVDLDHVRDASTGQLSPWAAGVVAELDSYSETSPSGAGVRIYARGRKPDNKASKVGDIEMYDGTTAAGKPGGRYLTVTGHKLPDAPADIRDRQEQITAVYQREMVEKRGKPGQEEAKAAGPGPQPGANGRAAAAARPRPEVVERGPALERLFDQAVAKMSDDGLIARLGRARNGPKFLRLWRGDTTDHEGDDSRADSALTFMLLRATRHDVARTDRLFRRSALFRGKWDSPRGEGTYGSLTIRKALEKGVPKYEPEVVIARLVIRDRPGGEPPRTFNVGTVSLTPDLARRTDSGKLAVTVRAARPDGKGTTLTVTSVLSNQEKAARRLADFGGDEAVTGREALDVLGELLTYAGERLDREAAQKADGLTVAEIVTAEVPRMLDITCRTRKGLWSEARGAELSRYDLAHFTPEALIEAAGRGRDAPRGDDRKVLRYDLLQLVEDDLKILHPTLLAELPRMHASDLDEHSEAAVLFRLQLLALWATLSTAITQRVEGADPIQVKASLIQRVVEASRGAHFKSVGRPVGWHPVHGSMSAWWCYGPPSQDGSATIWLSMRWHMVTQVRLPLLGVEDQDSLLKLGYAFKCFDPTPPPPIDTQLDRKAGPLAVLTQDLTQDLLAAPQQAARGKAGAQQAATGGEAGAQQAATGGEAGAQP
jgi:primase-polymerase (primpol)-like protein